MKLAMKSKGADVGVQLNKQCKAENNKYLHCVFKVFRVCSIFGKVGPSI